MARQVFSRIQYLEVLNEALRHHPAWEPGMAFEFFPRGSRARDAKWITCTGPDSRRAVYEEIAKVAASLCEIRE